MVHAKANSADTGKQKVTAAVTALCVLLLPIAALLAGCARVPRRGIIPPPPVTFACTASPTSLFAGDPITITAAPENFNPTKTKTYSWKTTGGVIAGPDRSTINIDTSHLAAGAYTVTGTISIGPRPGESATCSTSFTVKQFEPPTISCSANPTFVNPGDSATITALGMSPQNRHLKYSYSSSAGSIQGSGNTATLTTTGAPPGTITIMCNSLDDKGQTASATTTVTISAPAAPPPANGPFQVQCLAAPSNVRPGDPVTLDIISNAWPGDVVRWHTSAGVLDVGTSTNVIDTTGLASGKVNVSAEVTRSGRVAQCAASFNVDPNAEVTPWPFLDVVRIERKPGKPEAGGYAVYTYLLYRQRPDPNNKDDVARFKNILEAIALAPAPDVYGQPAEEQAPGAKPIQPTAVDKAVSRRKLAPIVVPVDGDVAFTVDELTEHYNTALAAQLLRSLNCQQTDDRTKCVQRLSGKGPYLVSTTIRISSHPNGFLMQDLTSTSPEVAGQWVSSFMAMVSKEHNWSGGYTFDRATRDFSTELDKAGGNLTASKTAIMAAMAWFKFK